MPRGRKKAQPEKEVTKITDNSSETSAEIAAPVVTENEVTEKTAKKAPSKRGKKPRTETKKAAAPVADNSVKAEAIPETTIEKADKTEKPANKTTSKGIRKTRSDKGTSKTVAKTKADNSVSKRGKKAESTSAAYAPAEVAEKVSAPAEKKKRTSNKKAKANKSEEFVIQSNGNDYTMSDITEMCKNTYRNGTRKQIKSIRVYVKSENNGIRAYYVINDKANGYIDL